jgi:alkylation response protein AidB-like acyl-CoA dehydrogenase
MIGFDPTDEQQLIAETVRQFAEKEIRPHARPSDEAGSISKRILEGAHELGLVTNSLPEAFGGGGERSAVTGTLVVVASEQDEPQAFLVPRGSAGLAATQITQQAVEMLGPIGDSQKLLVEKWMRDAKINDIFEGTQQINQLIVARRILDYSSAMLR